MLNGNEIFLQGVIPVTSQLVKRPPIVNNKHVGLQIYSVHSECFVYVASKSLLLKV